MSSCSTYSLTLANELVDVVVGVIRERTCPIIGVSDVRGVPEGARLSARPASEAKEDV
jgi:hypothetical protein